MANEKECCEPKRSSSGAYHATGGAFYGMGFLGSLVYFIQQADSFGAGLMGVLKAIFWPAVIIHKVLGILGL